MEATLSSGSDRIKAVQRGKQDLQKQVEPTDAKPRPAGQLSIPLTSTHPLPPNGVSQQLDHVLAFHITAPKTFCPGNEGALGVEEQG